MNNVNTSVGEEEYTLYGKSSITEILRGLTFQISANSFFQTNTSQAEVLYELIEDCAGLRGDGSEIILDLFCGTGTIGLTLARGAKHVYGYEVVAQAISDARRNAEQNGIHNATFIQGDLNKVSDNFGKEFPRPDIVISGLNQGGSGLPLECSGIDQVRPSLGSQLQQPFVEATNQFQLWSPQQQLPPHVQHFSHELQLRSMQLRGGFGNGCKALLLSRG